MGELLTGVVRGADPSEVEHHLASLDLLPVKVSLDTGSAIRSKLSFFQKKADIEDMILFTRQLSTLYQAGIPILKSLQIAAEQFTGRHFEEVILKIRDDLEKGEHFSDCLNKYPQIFSHIYVSSIRAAEASGKLDFILDKLADAMERDLVTKEEIKKAIRYPATVIIAIIAAFFVLVTFVVPKFAKFYESYDTPLPMPTQVIVALSNFLSEFWYIGLPIIIALIIGFIKLVKHPKMRRPVNKIMLKIPVMGSLFVKTALSRFSHLLSVLLASGTPLLQSLDIVKHAVGNVIIGDEIEILRKCQSEGRDLKEIKHYLKHFPILAVSLIHIGMESGSLELTLKEIARFFDRDIHYTSARLTSLLEPIMIFFIGGMVLFMALAIFLPMWSLISVFKS